MSLLMDALRRAESGKEKEQESNPATDASAHADAQTQELELEPATEQPNTRAEQSALLTHSEIDEMLGDGPDEISGPPAPAASSGPAAQGRVIPQLEPLTEGAIAETEMPVPAPQPAGSGGRLKSTMWFLSGLISVAAIVGGYYLWHSSESGEQALVTETMDFSIPAYQAPAEETRTENPQAPPEQQLSIHEPVVESQTAPAKPAPVASAKSTSPVNQGKTTRSSVRNATTRQDIKIHRTTRTDSVQATLQKGYLAYKAKEYPQADSFYHQVLKRYPHNRDALLGIAAIAMMRGDYVTARRKYERILKSNPADTTARLGLQSILGSEDPIGRISQLKIMTDKHPRNAQLRFSLANQYARIGQWTEAQRSYFEAVRLDPEQADYAYNLAISLDQIGLTEQALEFYLKARQLTGSTASLLDRQQLDSRIRQLQAVDGSNP